MDHAQLKSLLTEWQNCDSISHKAKLRKEIENLIVPILKRECQICKDFGVNSIWCNNAYYRANKGGLSLEGYENESVCMLYEYRGTFGEYCDLAITVPMKDIVNFDEGKLKARLKSKKIRNINEQISALKIKISKLETQLLDAEKL